ncbi:MAG: hypothetical protein FWD09_07845 [Lentimicrobiaceae bacterium]|nr:hypothetical protein [Lentimicrobiaceae bacterium]
MKTEAKKTSYLTPHTLYLIPLLLFSFLLFSLTSCRDPEERIFGSWNLQTVLINGETYTDSTQFHLATRYTYYNFFYMNSLDVRTYANGQSTASSNGFYKFKNNSTLELRFTLLYQQNEITAKIKKLTRKELNLEYEEEGDTYLLKLFTN